MAAVDWVTTAEVKAQLEIVGSARDAVIAAAITPASETLNARCEREVTPQTAGATRTFAIPLKNEQESGLYPNSMFLQGNPGNRITVDLAPYDLRAASTVTLHPGDPSSVVLVAGVDYALWPIQAMKTTGTYTQLRLSRYVTSIISTYSDRFGAAHLSVLGDWGAFTTDTVPENLKRACIVTVGSWIDKAVAQYGGDFGDSPRFMQAPTFDGYAVPRAALNILQSAGLIRFRVF